MSKTTQWNLDAMAAQEVVKQEKAGNEAKLLLAAARNRALVTLNKYRELCREVGQRLSASEAASIPVFEELDYAHLRRYHSDGWLLTGSCVLFADGSLRAAHVDGAAAKGGRHTDMHQLDAFKKGIGEGQRFARLVGKNDPLDLREEVGRLKLDSPFSLLCDEQKVSLYLSEGEYRSLEDLLVQMLVARQSNH